MKIATPIFPFASYIAVSPIRLRILVPYDNTKIKEKKANNNHIKMNTPYFPIF